MILAFGYSQGCFLFVLSSWKLLARSTFWPSLTSCHQKAKPLCWHRSALHSLAAIAHQDKTTHPSWLVSSSPFLPPKVRGFMLNSSQVQQGSPPYPFIRMGHCGMLSWLWEFVAQQSSRFSSSLTSLGWSSSTSKYSASLRYFTTGYSSSW